VAVNSGSGNRALEREQQKMRRINICRNDSDDYWKAVVSWWILKLVLKLLNENKRMSAENNNYGNTS